MKNPVLSRFFRVFTIISLAALALPRPALAQTTGLTYTVQSGDTLFYIAASFHTTVPRLLLVNSVPNPDMVNPGTVLVIPGFSDVVGEVVPVKLPVGESLDAFNRRTRVPAALINRIDFITNPDALYAGQDYFVIYKDEIPQVSLPVTGSLTDLELAVKQGVNPWLPAEYNDLAGTWDLLPNDTLFLPADQVTNASTGTQPLTAMKVSPLPLEQGKTTEFRAGISGDAALSGTLGAYTLHFFPTSDGNFIALQGIERMADSGLLPLVLTLTQPDGSTFSIQQNLRLRYMDYGTDTPFQVADEYIDPAVTQPEFDKIRDLTLVVTPERLWDKAFMAPDPYPDCLTSTFGRLRSYNGSNYTYFHAGSDFCGSPQDPAYAAANGTVVFVGELTVRGNAILISHGWGVYSGYWHLSQTYVAVGDYVEAGRKIGMVGATGRVTGPHLHFEMMVGGVQVDPTDWLNGGFADY